MTIGVIVHSRGHREHFVFSIHGVWVRFQCSLQGMDCTAPKTRPTGEMDYTRKASTREEIKAEEALDEFEFEQIMSDPLRSVEFKEN